MISEQRGIGYQAVVNKVGINCRITPVLTLSVNMESHEELVFDSLCLDPGSLMCSTLLQGFLMVVPFSPVLLEGALLGWFLHPCNVPSSFSVKLQVPAGGHNYSIADKALNLHEANLGSIPKSQFFFLQES